jgi:hypothetical protein
MFVLHFGVPSVWRKGASGFSRRARGEIELYDLAPEPGEHRHVKGN